MTSPSTWIARHGRCQPPPERVELRAGPLCMVYENADLRCIRLGEREVVRRIYFAVRDRHWGTVAFDLSDVRVDAAGDSFAISFDADHRQGDVRFVWHGSIKGGADGTVEFRAEGRALSTFLSNRIGICVLHPVRECAGRPCTVEHSDGSATQGEFPRYIAPHQPFTDVRAISHEVCPGVTAEVRLDGEVFEMEDQRNWTDQSFKTYSTPLRLPFPVEVREGTAIAQSVTLRLNGRPPRAAVRTGGPRLVVASGPTGTLPRIGLGMAGTGRPVAERELDRLRRLRLDHLRVDLRPDRPDWRAALERACREAEALDAGVEAAVFLSDAADSELAALRAAATARVLRWLVFPADGPVTTPALLALARPHLTRIGVGTNLYFAELNRGRPPLDGADLICFTINPQVHAFDNASVMEALEGQASVVESARQFAGGLPLAVTPVTLRPRFNPDSGVDETAPDGGPFSVDVRQTSLFGAAWTVGSLKRLAEGGVRSVTCYETTGPRGALDEGGVFPLYHVLADLAEFAGADVLPVTSSDPLTVDGLAVTRDGRTRLLVANLTDGECDPAVEDVAGTVRVRYIDETNVGAAMHAPEEFRRDKGREATVAAGLRLHLRPYAVACVDVTEEEAR